MRQNPPLLGAFLVVLATAAHAQTIPTAGVNNGDSVRMQALMPNFNALRLDITVNCVILVDMASQNNCGAGSPDADGRTAPLSTERAPKPLPGAAGVLPCGVVRAMPVGGTLIPHRSRRNPTWRNR